MNYKNDYKNMLLVGHEKLGIVFKSILIGISVGVVTILYRLALSNAEALNGRIYSYISHNLILIIPTFLILITLGWLIGWLVIRYPMIGGSGIPQVEGQLLGYFQNLWVSTLLTKFIGGTICILAGLSVGREGPCIQLGASTAQGLGDRLAKTRTEKKILIASGASAGLAAAFNAPLAGVMFSLEEVFKYFSPTILLATVTAAITSDFVANIIFGLKPVFSFKLQDALALNYYWLLLLLGVLVGIFGALYNKILLTTMRIYKKIPEKTRPVIAFITAGVLGLIFPIVLGGGERIIQALSLNKSVSWLVIVLLLKFIFSMISFGSGAPGGIFFPLLVLGALIGSIFGNISICFLGINPDLFFNFVVFSMAGLFAAIVRAPITGIILLTEMTGSFNHLLPLTVVSIAAYVTADLLKSTPIYESLLELKIAGSESAYNFDHDISKKITVEMVVHHGSQIENSSIKDLFLPLGNLVIAVKRHGRDITPSGNTKIKAGDYLVVLTSTKDESILRETLKKMCQ